jgi:RNA polymerase sigma-70 factor (ECF subfamily)
MRNNLGFPPTGNSDWDRLLELLAPIHAKAAGTARRLAGSAHDGDDLFQEAVLRARSGLSSLRDPNRFGPWFFSILLNVHRNRSRRGFWKRFLPFDPGTNPSAEPAGEDGSDWEVGRLGAQRASRALAALSADQREAVVLFEIEGFSVEEIAVLQHVSASAVKSRLARGRARLRRIYLRWGFGPERGHQTAERNGTTVLPVLARLVPEEEPHDRTSRA